MITPAFRVQVEGSDITSRIADRLLDLTLTDHAGIESDSVEIRLDDAGHVIEFPRTGAKLSVSLGYRESELEKMGLFVVMKSSCPDRPASC